MIRFVTALLLMFGLLAAPAHAASGCFTVFYDLFGPQPGSNNGYTYTPQTDWATPTAFTANSKPLLFQYPSLPIVNAQYKVVWYPYGDSIQAKLTKHVTSPITDITIIDPPVAAGPIVSSADVTSQFQQMAADGIALHITEWFKGNGTDQVILYAAHVRVVYCLEP